MPVTEAPSFWYAADNGTSSGTNSPSQSTWISWNLATTSSSTTSYTAITWEGWNGNYVTGYAPPARVATPEEIAEHRKLAAKDKAEREAAEAVAEALLRECLDAIQLAEFESTKGFVVSVKSGKRYRIRPNARVQELTRDGLLTAELCIHPDWGFPAGDTMLAQKLMLETNEKRFREIANISQFAGPRAA